MGKSAATRIDPNDPLKALAEGLSGFGHPVRIRSLVLWEFVYSPSAITHALGDTPLGVVSYHARMLRDYGMIELSHTEPKRGALEHFYHRTELGDDLVSALRAILNVPPRKAGRAGTDKRKAELEAWAYRAPAPEPVEEAMEEAAA